MNDISNWNSKFVRVAKRFNGNINNQKLWYIEGSDIIVDVRNAAQGGPDIQASLNHTSLIAEKDILISGSKGLSMLTYVDTSSNETFPNIATQTGNIYSNFTPEGSTESQKSSNRSFDGLIYTNTGNISFNYANGIAMMGYNVTLDGLIKLEYEGRYIDTGGFGGTLSKVTWQEQ